MTYCVNFRKIGYDALLRAAKYVRHKHNMHHDHGVVIDNLMEQEFDVKIIRHRELERFTWDGEIDFGTEQNYLMWMLKWT